MMLIQLSPRLARHLASQNSLTITALDKKELSLFLLL